jgi:hypothetical protein
MSRINWHWGRIKQMDSQAVRQNQQTVIQNTANIRNRLTVRPSHMTSSHPKHKNTFRAEQMDSQAVTQNKQTAVQNRIDGQSGRQAVRQNKDSQQTGVAFIYISLNLLINLVQLILWLQLAPYLFSYRNRFWQLLTWSPYWRGRLSTIGLLVLTSSYLFILILNMLFLFATKQARLARSSTVPSLPLQIVFPGICTHLLLYHTSFQTLKKQIWRHKGGLISVLQTAQR